MRFPSHSHPRHSTWRLSMVKRLVRMVTMVTVRVAQATKWRTPWIWLRTEKQLFLWRRISFPWQRIRFPIQFPWQQVSLCSEATISYPRQRNRTISSLPTRCCSNRPTLPLSPLKVLVSRPCTFPSSIGAPPPYSPRPAHRKRRWARYRPGVGIQSLRWSLNCAS